MLKEEQNQVWTVTYPGILNLKCQNSYFALGFSLRLIFTESHFSLKIWNSTQLHMPGITIIITVLWLSYDTTPVNILQYLIIVVSVGCIRFFSLYAGTFLSDAWGMLHYITHMCSLYNSLKMLCATNDFPYSCHVHLPNLKHAVQAFYNM